jgi:hypothetical protein
MSDLHQQQLSRLTSHARGLFLHQRPSRRQKALPCYPPSTNCLARAFALAGIIASATDLHTHSHHVVSKRAPASPLPEIRQYLDDHLPLLPLPLLLLPAQPANTLPATPLQHKSPT